MKSHFGSPGVFSYPGFHKVKSTNQIGKGKAFKPKLKLISPIAATDERMKLQAKKKTASKKKKSALKKKISIKQSSM